MVCIFKRSGYFAIQLILALMVLNNMEIGTIKLIPSGTLTQYSNPFQSQHNRATKNVCTLVVWGMNAGKNNMNERQGVILHVDDVKAMNELA